MVTNYLFSFLFLLSSCSFPPSSKKLNAEEAFTKDRDKRVYSALRKFKCSMEAQGYRAAGVGEGIDHSTGKQKYLGVTFDIERLPTVDFARQVEVKALQEFLCYINSEEGIQDYVAEYPYPLKFIRIAFISRHPETGLFSVANFENEIYYCQDNPIGPLIKVHRESYEDAVQILQEQQAQGEG